MFGKQGEAGQSTKARLTVISNTECRVEADTTGDGNYDYDTGDILWEDLSKVDSNDDNSDDKKLIEVDVDSCFELSSGSAKTDPECENEDFHFRTGGRVDIGLKEEIFCLQQGTFTDLDSVPSDYSDCNRSNYVEGSLGEEGLKNKAAIVRDVSNDHHYKMRFIENELPTITFEYKQID
jgi:hypothetical protein